VFLTAFYKITGRAQAMNLRDSGVKSVTIGNIDDEYKQTAIEDGWSPVSISEATAGAEVILLLIPDEVQQEVWKTSIKDHIAKDHRTTLVVASGYAVAFNLLDIPEQMDVVMVAPRMIGAGVRDRFLAQEPYPCFVSVEKDSSEEALAVALSVSAGIGAMTKARGGKVVSSSCREEAAIDLFAEQALWPAINTCFLQAFDTLKAAGFSEEAILHDMYLSKEPAEVFERAATVGFFHQLKFHSKTSQFGQLRGTKQNPNKEIVRQQFEKVLHKDILSGDFANFWSGALAEGASELDGLWNEVEEEPIAKAEKTIGVRK
jgi:ketol-acid reductoisomerase